MTSHTAITSIDSPDEFCLALKAARESKGLALTDIESVTKIPAYLFDALEHNDLRRWPTGFFRRSFFRDYVTAIGVPVADACAQFAKLFPEQEADPVLQLAKLETPSTAEPATPLSRFKAVMNEGMATALAASLATIAATLVLIRTGVRIKLPKIQLVHARFWAGVGRRR